MTPRSTTAVATLLGLAFSVCLIAILGFFFLFDRSTKELRQISNDLYIHPFTVNGAAYDLKTSLYQIRGEALMVVLMKTRNEEWKKSVERIEEFEQTAYKDLGIIQSSFLGDMSRVALLEREMQQWHSIRNAILMDVRLGNFAAADRSVKEFGTPKFNSILVQVNYILDFSRSKAAFFVDDADRKSDELLFRGQVLALALFFVVLVTALGVVWRVRYLHNELTRQATLDFSTGVHNRRNFLAMVQDETYRSTRYGQKFSLAVVDLDHFKTVNDTYGHHTGDVALKHFCAICLAGLRKSDVLGRLGGEEFGILMPNTPLADAQGVIERIRLALEQSRVRDGKFEFPITGSFGLVTFDAAHGSDNLDALFKAADTALYSAKANGRNQIAVASEVTS